MLPASFNALASGVLNSALMTTGWQVNPRTWAMKAVFVPLPEPGAPPSKMISLGNRRLSWPTSCSTSRQTESKMSWASLISRSLRLVTGATATGAESLVEIINSEIEWVHHTSGPRLTHAVCVRKGSAYARRQQAKNTVVCVKFRADADGERGIHRDVAEGQAGDDGNLEWEQAVFQNFFQCLAIFLGSLGLRVVAIGVQADGDARDLLEQAAVRQIGEHAIPAIRCFTDVFEEEDGVVERGLPRRADDGAKQGEIAADEPAARDP